MVRVVEEYATALLRLAVQNHSVEQTFAQASQWLARNGESTGPVEDAEVPQGTLADFLSYLKQKDRQELAGNILRRYLELAQTYVGVVKVEVVSAAPLSQERLDDLQQRLIRRSGKRVYLTHRVDPSLIAGIRLIADGVVLDTSVKRRLADMREKLYKGGVFYPWTQ